MPSESLSSLQRDEIEDYRNLLEAFSIRGDLWFVADGNKPNRSGGAGRGTKQHVVIESGRLQVFSSSSDQSRMLKGLTMRTLRRVSWFIHDPQSAASSSLSSKIGVSVAGAGGSTASLRGRGGKGSTTGPSARTSSAPGAGGAPATGPGKYYYLVMEAVYDNREEGTTEPARRERLVFATDSAADFQLWMRYFDQVNPDTALDRTDMIDGKSVVSASSHSTQQSRAVAGAAADDAESGLRATHLRLEAEKLASFGAEWKRRAQGLFTQVRQLFEDATSPLPSTGAGDTSLTSTPDADNWSESVEGLIAQLRVPMSLMQTQRSTTTASSARPPLGGLGDASRSGSHTHHAVVTVPSGSGRAGDDASLSLFGSTGFQETKIHELQRLVEHYVRTESAACDVVNDFARRHRSVAASVLKPQQDTPSKLKAIYSFLHKRLTQAWVAIASQPRSMGQGSMQAQSLPGGSFAVSTSPSRSQSMDTLGVFSRADSSTTLPYEAFVSGVSSVAAANAQAPPPIPDSIVDAALSLQLPVEEVMNLVSSIRQVVSKCRAEGHYIPSDAPLAQQHDVAMEYIKVSSEVDANRREMQRRVETHTEYLLSELARLKTILQAKDLRLAEADVHISRLEEHLGHRNPVKDAPSRDTERSVIDVIRLLEHQLHIQIPPGTNAVRIRFAMESLLSTTSPLYSMLSSPQEAFAAQVVIESKTQQIRRLERIVEGKGRVEEDMHRHLHHLLSGSPTGGSSPGGPKRAQQLQQERVTQLEALQRELGVQQQQWEASDVVQQRDHWIERCVILERELMALRASLRTTGSPVEDAASPVMQRRSTSPQLSPMSPDAAATAAVITTQMQLDTKTPTRPGGATANSKLTTAGTSAAARPTTSTHPQHDMETQRFVQLLTMKNRQIAALQEQLNSAHSSATGRASGRRQSEDMSEAATLDELRSGSPLDPAAATARGSSFGAFSQTETMALEIIDRAETELDLCVPMASTSSRLEYVFDILIRDALIAADSKPYELGNSETSPSSRTSPTVLRRVGGSPKRSTTPTTARRSGNTTISPGRPDEVLEEKIARLRRSQQLMIDSIAINTQSLAKFTDDSDLVLDTEHPGASENVVAVFDVVVKKACKRLSQSPSSPVGHAAARTSPRSPLQTSVALSALERSAVDAITFMQEEEDTNAANRGSDDAPPDQVLREGVKNLISAVKNLQTENRKFHLTDSENRRELVVARGEVSELTRTVTALEADRDNQLRQSRSLQRLLHHVMEELAEVFISFKRSMTSTIVDFTRHAALTLHEASSGIHAAVSINHRLSSLQQQGDDTLKRQQAAEIEFLRQQVASANAELDGVRETLEAKSQSLDQENRELRKQLRDAQTALSSVGMEWSRKVDASTTELLQLRQQFSDAVASHQRQREELDGYVARYKAECDSSQSQVLKQRRELDEAMTSLRRMTDDNRRLQTQLEQLALEHSESEMVTSRDTDSLKSHLQSRTAALEDASQQLILLRQSRDRELAAAGEALLRERRVWEHEISVVQTRLDALQQSLARQALGNPAVTSVSILCLPTVEVAGPSTSDYGADHASSSSSSYGNATDELLELWMQIASSTSAPPTSIELPANISEAHAATLLNRMRSFAAWCKNRVAPFAFGANAQCSSIMDTIVWAIESHIRLLQGTAPLFLVGTNNNANGTVNVSAAGAPAAGSGGVHDPSDIVAWKIKELSEAYQRLSDMLEHHAQLIRPAFPSLFPQIGAAGGTSAGTIAGRSTHHEDIVSGLVRCAQAMQRLMEGIQLNTRNATNPFAELESRVHWLAQRAAVGDALASVVAEIPRIVSSTIVSSSDVKVPESDESFAEYLSSCLEGYQAIFRVVEASLAPDLQGEPLPRGADSLKLQLASVRVLEKELDRSRNDLRVALDAMAKDHAQRTDELIDERNRMEEEIQELRRQLHDMSESLHEVEVHSERLNESHGAVERLLEEARSERDRTELALRESQLQLKRYEVDVTESLRHLGMQHPHAVLRAARQHSEGPEASLVEQTGDVPSASTPGGTPKEGGGPSGPAESLIHMVASTAERLRALEKIIQEAGWAIQMPTGSTQPASTPRASLSPDRQTMQQLFSSPNSSPLGNASAVDAVNDPSFNGNPLVAMCRQTAQEVQVLRGERDLLQRDVAAYRAAVEDIAFHIKMDLAELRSASSTVPGKPALVAALPVIVQSVQSLKHASDVTMQDYRLAQQNASTLVEKLSRLMEAHDALRAQHDAAMEANDAYEREASVRVRDLKADLENTKRQNSELKAQLAVREAQYQDEVRVLQERVHELQEARAQLLDTHRALQEEHHDTTDTLRTALTEVTGHRDQLEKQCDTLLKDLSAALQLATTAQPMVQIALQWVGQGHVVAGSVPKTCVEVAAQLHEVTFLWHVLQIDASETADRRLVELRAFDGLAGLWMSAGMFDALHRSGETVSMLGLNGVQELPDAVASLMRREAAFKQLCGDTSIGRRGDEGVTRSEAIVAIREALDILAGHIEDERESHVLFNDDDVSLTDGLLAVVRANADCIRTSRDLIESQSAEIRTMRDDIRRLSVGANDTQLHYDATRWELLVTKLQQEEIAERRLVELRGDAAQAVLHHISTAVDGRSSVLSSWHVAAQAASFLNVHIEDVPQCVAVLLKSEATLKALVGDSVTIFRRDASSRELLLRDSGKAAEMLLGAMNTIQSVIHGGSTGTAGGLSVGVAFDDSDIRGTLLNVVDVAVTTLEQQASQLRDLSAEHRKSMSDIQTLKEALEDARATAKHALDAEGMLSIRLMELQQRSTIGLRGMLTMGGADEAVLLGFHELAKIMSMLGLRHPHECAQEIDRLQKMEYLLRQLVGMSQIEMNKTDATPSILPGPLDHISPSIQSAMLVFLGGPPMRVAVDRPRLHEFACTRSQCLDAIRESCRLLSCGDDTLQQRVVLMSDLELPGHLLELTERIVNESMRYHDSLQEMIPQYQRASQDAQNHYEDLVHTRNTLRDEVVRNQLTSLSEEEARERSRIDIYHLTQFVDNIIAPYASSCMSSCSIVATALNAPSIDSNGILVRSLLESERRFRELVGEPQSAVREWTEVQQQGSPNRAADLTVTRAACLSTIMNALATLRAEVKGNILSSFTNAVQNAARTLEENAEELPALTTRLRLLHQEHVALRHEHRNTTDDCARFKSMAEELAVFWEEEGERRVLERQAEMQFSSLVLPLLASIAAHGIRMTSMLHTETTSLAPIRLQHVLDSHAHLANLVGEAPEWLPNEPNRTELLHGIMECFEALRVEDLPRQNFVTELVSCCRSAARQIEGDSLTIQTLAADLRRTQDELSHYAILSHDARDQLERNRQTSAQYEVLLEEFDRRLGLVQAESLARSEDMVGAVLGPNFRFIAETASALGVGSLSDVANEAYRNVRDIAVLTSLVGDVDVAPEMGSRSDIVHSIIRSFEVLEPFLLTSSPDRRHSPHHNRVVIAARQSHIESLEDAATQRRQAISSVQLIAGCRDVVDHLQQVRHQLQVAQAEIDTLREEAAAQTARLSGICADFESSRVLSIGRTSSWRSSSTDGYAAAASPLVATVSHLESITAAVLDEVGNHHAALRSIVPDAPATLSPHRTESAEGIAQAIATVAAQTSRLAREVIEITQQAAEANAKAADAAASESQLKDHLNRATTRLLTDCAPPAVAVPLLAAFASPETHRSIGGLVEAFNSAVDVVADSCRMLRQSCSDAVKVLQSDETLKQLDVVPAPAGDATSSFTDDVAATTALRRLIHVLPEKVSRLLQSQRTGIDDAAELTAQIRSLTDAAELLERRCQGTEGELRTETENARRLREMLAEVMQQQQQSDKFWSGAVTSLLQACTISAPLMTADGEANDDVSVDDGALSANDMSVQRIHACIHHYTSEMRRLENDVSTLTEDRGRLLERSERLEQDNEKLNSRLDDVLTQIRQQQDHDAQRSRHLESLTAQLAEERRNFEGREQSLQQTTDEQVATLRRQLREEFGKLQAATEDINQLDRTLAQERLHHEQVVTDAEGRISSLVAEVRERDDSLATLFRTMRESTIVDCCAAWEASVAQRARTRLELEEMSRRVALLTPLAAGCLPKDMKEPLYVGSAVAAHVSAIVGARRYGDAVGMVQRLKDDHKTLKSLCGDISVGYSGTASERDASSRDNSPSRGSTIVTRSEALLAIYNALALLSDVANFSSDEQVENSKRIADSIGSATDSSRAVVVSFAGDVCTRLRDATTAILEQLAAYRGERNSLRATVEQMSEQLRAYADASTAVFQKLEQSRSGGSSFVGESKLPWQDAAPAMAALSSAAVEVTDELEFHRENQKRLANCLAQCRGGPAILSGETLVLQARVIADELVSLRSRIAALEDANEDLTAQRARLLACVSSALTLMTPAVAADTPVQGGTGDDVFAQCNQLDAAVTMCMRALRAERKRMADVTSLIVASGGVDDMNSKPSGSLNVSGASDVAVTHADTSLTSIMSHGSTATLRDDDVSSVIASLIDSRRTAREELERMVIQTRRTEQRLQQTRDDLQAAVERHTAEIAEKENELRFTEARSTEAADRLREQLANQRARLLVLEQCVDDATAALHIPSRSADDGAGLQARCEALMEGCIAVRAECDSLAQQRRLLQMDVRSSLDRGLQLEEEVQRLRREMDEMSRTMRDDEASLSDQLMKERQNVADLKRDISRLQGERDELVEKLEVSRVEREKEVAEHEDKLARLGEVHMTEVELVHSRMRDRDEYCASVEHALSGTRDECASLRIALESHLRLTKCASLDGVRDLINSLGHITELLQMQVEEGEVRSKLLLRCVTAIPMHGPSDGDATSVSSVVATAFHGAAMVSSHLGSDVSMLDMPTVVRQRLAELSSMQALLYGSDAAADLVSTENSSTTESGPVAATSSLWVRRCTIPRQQLLHCVFRAATQLRHGLQAGGVDAVPERDETNLENPNEVDRELRDLTVRISNELLETKAVLQARNADVKRSVEECRQWRLTLRDVSKELLRGKRAHAALMNAAPPKDVALGADGDIKEVDESIVQQVEGSSEAWRAALNDSRELSDSLVLALEHLTFTAQTLVPTALVHLRGVTSTSTLIDSLQLAAQRAASELTTLREEKASLTRQLDQTRTQLECYTSRVPQVVRGLAVAATTQQTSLNASFTLPADVSTASAIEDHQTLCDDLLDRSQQIIGDNKRLSNVVRECEEVLRALQSQQRELKLQESDVATHESEVPLNPRVAPLVASVTATAEAVTSLQSEVVSLTGLLTKAEQRMEQLRDELAQAQEQNESRSLQTELQAVELEQHHKDALDRVKQAMQGAQKHVTLLQHFVSDVAHVLDIHENWDHEHEFLQTVRQRIETIKSLLEQHQQTVKQQGNELKALRTKEADLRASQSVLEHQIEMLNLEVEEQVKSASQRSRESKKEQEAAQRHINELQHQLERETEHRVEQEALVAKGVSEIARLREVHAEALSMMEFRWKSEVAELAGAIDTSAEALNRQTEACDALQRDVASLLRNVRIPANEGLDGVVALVSALRSQVSLLELQLEEAGNRRELMSQEATALVTSERRATPLQGLLAWAHTTPTLCSRLSTPDAASAFTVLSSIMESEQQLQDQLGDTSLALKTGCPRSALVSALMNCRMYLGMPFELELEGDAFARGTSAAVKELCEENASLNSRLRSAVEHSESSMVTVQLLLESVQAATLILCGPHNDMSALLATPTRGVSHGMSPASGRPDTPPPVHSIPSRASVAHMVSALERAAHGAAERARVLKAAASSCVTSLHKALPSGSSLVASSSQTAESLCDSLQAVVDRCVREIATAQQTHEQMNDSLNRANGALDIFNQKVSGVLRLLPRTLFASPSSQSTPNVSTDSVDPKSDDSTAETVYASPSVLCSKLHNGVQQLVEHWLSTSLQLQQVTDHLASIASSGSDTIPRANIGPAMMAAGAVDTVRELERTIEQQSNRIKTLDARLQQLQQEYRSLQDSSNASLQDAQRQAQTLRETSSKDVESVRIQLLELQKRHQRLLSAATDASVAVHGALQRVQQEQTDADDAVHDGTETSDMNVDWVIKQLVPQTMRCVSLLDASQQQLRRVSGQLETTDLELQQAARQARAEQERAQTLFQRLQDVQIQRDTLEKRLKHDTASLTASCAELESRLSVERREREARQFQLISRMSEFSSSVQRLADHLSIRVAPRDASEREEGTDAALAASIAAATSDMRPDAVVDRCLAKWTESETRIKQLTETATHLQRELQTIKASTDDERSRTAQQLERAMSEAHERRTKEEGFISQFEALFEEHKDIVAGWAAAPAGPTKPSPLQHIFGLVSSTLAQLARKQKLLDMTEKTQTQLEAECARVGGQLATHRDELRRLNAERDELSKELTKLQKAYHVKEVAASTQNAEFDNVKQNLHKLFVAVMEGAQSDLGVKVPENPPDNTAASEVATIHHLWQHIARKFRSAPSEDEMHRLTADWQAVIDEEREARLEAEAVQRMMRDQLLPYLLPPSVRQIHMVVPRNSNTSDAPTPLSPSFHRDLLDTAKKTQENLLVALAKVREFTDVTVEQTPSDFLGVSCLLRDAVTQLHSHHHRIIAAANTVADALQVEPLMPVSSSTTTGAMMTIESSARRWSDAVVDAARKGESEVFSLLQKIAEMLKAFHTALPAVTETTALLDGAMATLAGAQRDSTRIVSLNASQTTSAMIADVREKLLSALQQYIRSIVTQHIHLTSEWQAVGDQTNRLMLEKRALLDEREAIEAHIGELRRVVRKKIDDDRRAEEKLAVLDQHLDSQSRAFVQRYQNDRDHIQRIFGEMRHAIHSAVRAPSVTSNLSDGAASSRSISAAVPHVTSQQPSFRDPLMQHAPYGSTGAAGGRGPAYQPGGRGTYFSVPSSASESLTTNASSSTAHMYAAAAALKSVSNISSRSSSGGTY